ncbi:MAG TPA: orotate phosphoribosyltransferase [Anaerolineales bacterium]|nr:orotate phosphoribosyltransferase [Anaerolineales bacterium]
MKQHVRDFIEMLIDNGVLQFGTFKLKSGRISPYFMNFGAVNKGRALRELTHAYARTLNDSYLKYDMLFGPAYKGIPLVASLSTVLSLGVEDVPFCYNRKELKDHGEGGIFIGTPPEGRVMIVDDVLTAGTAVRESIKLLRDAGATPVGVIIAFDRCERDNTRRNPIKELESEGINVLSVATVFDLMRYLHEHNQQEVGRTIEDYHFSYHVGYGDDR